MRTSILQLLKNLRTHSKDKEITDADILIWANNKVKESGKTSCIENFKVHQPSLFHLILAIVSSADLTVICIDFLG